MNDSATVDVLVVGAGPAGAVTATGLARRGIQTLLIGDDSRSRATYDVLLSAPALSGLQSLADLEATARPVEAVELLLGDRSATRLLNDAGATVCDRQALCDQLRRSAMAAGADFHLGKVTSLDRRTEGDHLATVQADGVTNVLARHVVLATGADAGGAPHTTGIACVQRFASVGPGPRIMLALATPRTIDPHEGPTCVWVLPGDDGDTCTVGASKLEGLAPDGVETLLETALAVLRDAGLSFDACRPVGPLVGGVLSTGFAPGNASRAGRMLVGDAAGLVNPFTGEGLSYAVQSGLLAARAITEHLHDPDRASHAYSRSLARTFIGYFETARHAARRYHLTWRMLATTANSDHPLFAKARRAILLPEGIGGLGAAEHMELPAGDVVLVGPFLAACDEVAIMTVRREWPFIARLLISGDGLPHQRLRPAVLLFAGLLATGAAPDVRRATVGAAIELATLGALAFLGPTSPSHPPGRAVDLGTTAIVLAGDFLLSQASRLVADAAPEISWSFADWLGELTALRAARLEPSRQVGAATVFGSLLEFPVRIGGQLAGASSGVVRALRDFGHHCGQAFLHADDVLALRGERTRLDASLEAMLNGRLSAIPDLLQGQPVDSDLLATNPQLRSAALAASTAACQDAQRRALEATRAMPNTASARILRQFVSTVVSPSTHNNPHSAPRPGPERRGRRWARRTCSKPSSSWSDGLA